MRDVFKGGGRGFSEERSYGVSRGHVIYDASLIRYVMSVNNLHYSLLGSFQTFAQIVRKAIVINLTSIE